MTARVWIGLDPSIRAFGWAVLSSGYTGVVGLGTWETTPLRSVGKMADSARRVDFIATRLLELIDCHRPSEAYVESLVLGQRNGMLATSILGRVRGVVEGICKARGVALSEIRPDVLKAAIAGARDASKEQVARVLCRLYPYSSVFNADDNATDALAVAHVCGGRSLSRATPNVVRYAPVVPDDSDIDF